MKLCVAQTRSAKGDLRRNLVTHQRFIDAAVSQGAHAVVFPELSLTGYEPTLAADLAVSPGDALLSPFQRMSDDHHITIGVGVPTRPRQGLCISLVLFLPHHPQLVYSKKYLHADEQPYFVSGTNYPTVPIGQCPVGLAICYELSVPAHVEEAHRHGAELYLASASKSLSGVNAAHQRLTEIAQTYDIPVMLSNNVGPSDAFVAAGRSAVWSAHGELLGQLGPQDEGLLFFDTSTHLVKTILL